MRRFLILALSGLALSLPSIGCSAEPAADKAFGDKVRAYLMEHPEVIQEAIDKLQEKTEAALAKASKTAIADHRAKLERDARDPVEGNAGGAIVVTEFFDYRCPYCRVAGPHIADLLARHKNVRFVFKEFPILSEASEHAARLALAAKAQGKYFPVHVALMSAPTLNDQVVDDILRKNGVDLVRAKRDAMSEAVTAQINDVHALARTLGVTGTPSFVIGDRISNGWSPDEIDEDIAVVERTGANRKG